MTNNPHSWDAWERKMREPKETRIAKRDLERKAAELLKNRKQLTPAQAAAAEAVKEAYS